MTPEGRVKASVRKALREAGCLAIPYNAQGIGVSGVPDDLVLAPRACFFTIEYKARMRWDRNHRTALATLPTMLQADMMERIRALGFSTYVIDGALADRVLPALALLGQHCRPGDDLRMPLALALARCRWTWACDQLRAWRALPPDEAAGCLAWPFGDRVCVPTLREGD